MMEMTIRPMTPQEHMYSYSQSQQIMGQTGCIGHLRADFGSSGQQFYSTWNDHWVDLKTDAFKAEFDDVINALRSDERYGGILKNRGTLAAYCYTYPDSSFGGGGREFGFRADTEQYSYMLRLNPNRGEYNLYCYCYRRDRLDRHLKQAEKGIRFITPDYKEKFRIPDGDSIRSIMPGYDPLDEICRYVDEAHVEVGRNLYHICEFAERMKANGVTVIPMRSSLPDNCYAVLPGSTTIIIVEKGEKGYYPTDIKVRDRAEALQFVAESNERGGVTKAQAAAMLSGSMFGWDCPAADPKSYDENGTPIRPKHKDRGDAR